ncbi:Amino acid adenylation, partial [Pseudomonas syringae pv. aptata]
MKWRVSDMDKSAAERIAQRFVGLPVEQRRQILAKMYETGQSFKLLPIAVTRHAAARIPLSYAQQRMLFLWQMEPGNAAYNVPMAVRLNGALNRQALSEALDLLVQRHETLRTRFVSEDGAFYQEILEQATVALEFASVAPADIEQQVRAELQKPFDLLSGTLLRVKLFQLSESEHVLTVCMHHVVSDGWSGEVLIREFVQLYQAQVSGQPVPLPALAIQYADYAIWQRAWLEAGEGERQLHYWKQQLGSEHPLLSLPLDHPRPLQPSHRGASVRVDLPQQLSAQLKSLARNNGQTLFMVTLAALSVVLSRFSGQSDLRIGAPNAGRTRSELEGLIGLFVNTLAIRIDTASAPTGEVLLAQVRTRVLEAQDHQDLPFEQVVEIVRPTRSLAHGPLFQTTLNWLAGETTLPEMDGLSLATVEQQSQVSKFDLSLNLGEQGDALFGTLDYATALFDEATVQRYCGYFEQLLRTLVSNQQAVLADIPLVGPQEREYLLDTLNASAVSLPQGQTIHALIEARAEGMPEAVAARVGEQSLSYAQMNRQANSLAHHLISLGVRPDDRVAVVARRGLDTLVSLLAVLKSGACYVPVDPAHPDERINYLLTDSAPVVVLAEQAFMARLPALTVPLLALDRPQWPEQPANPLVSGQTPGDLAYVIYTSGSTGQPKGVMVEHRTLANLVHWHCQAFALHAGSHTATVAGFGFDAMAWEVWP